LAAALNKRLAYAVKSLILDDFGGTLMSTDNVDGRRWRARAAEMRELAQDMDDEICKEMALQIARDYERLADRADHAADLKVVKA
jgi:hypothetical protein